MPLYYPPTNYTIGGNSTSGGAGYAKISSGTMTLAGGNNITLSQAGNNITISAANITVTGIPTLSFWPDIIAPVSTATQFLNTYYSGSTSSGAGANSTQSGYTFSLYAQPFVLPCNLIYNSIMMILVNTATSQTAQGTQIWSAGIYSNNASTLSLIQDYYGGMYLSTNGLSILFTIWTASTAGATSNASGWGGISTASLRTGSNTGVWASCFQNDRYVRIDNNTVGITLTGGNYWYVFGNFNGSGVSGAPAWASPYKFTSLTATSMFTELGANTSLSNNTLMSGFGAFSTTYTSQSTAATMFKLPTNIALTNISTSASANFKSHYFQLARVSASGGVTN